jgi:hypothetical protein
MGWKRFVACSFPAWDEEDGDPSLGRWYLIAGGFKCSILEAER